MSRRAARIERIRKLLALAHDQEGTPEGEAAARRARDLMRQQSVAMADLDAHQRGARDPIGKRAIDLGGKEHWRRQLAGEVAVHCECLLTFKSGNGGAFLYGHQSGVDIAEYLLVLLTRQVEQAREARFRPELERASRARDLADFTQSAVLAVQNRLRQLRQGEGDGPETRLIHQRSEDLRRWLEARGYQFKNLPPSPFGYNQDGYEAGHRIPMHDAVAVGGAASGLR
jgi:Protein of unknown function (DUF2786)